MHCALLQSFEEQFLAVEAGSRKILADTSDAQLFEPYGKYSIAEHIVRSAAVVEQTFNGITTRLWDDPFEWTLPEKLSTRGAILEYLHEVEQTRRRAFTFFTTDQDLNRQIPAPERLAPLDEILQSTLAKATAHQANARKIGIDRLR